MNDIQSSRPYTFDRVVRLIIGLAIIVLLVLLVDRLSTVLLPFVIGWLLAYLFHPVVVFFQKRLKIKNRILAIICTILLLLIVITGIVWVLIPLISKEVEKFSQLVTLYTQSFNVDSFLPVAWQNKIRDFFKQLDIQAILNDQSAKDLMKNIAPKLWGVVNSSLSFIFGLVVIVIVFLYFIFILLDYEKMNQGLIHMIPPKYRDLITEIILDLKNGMNRYFRGQALIAFIDGVLFAIGFAIIGLPLGVVLGLFMGVLNLVPYMQALGYIPALLLGLLKSAETGQSYWSVLLGILIVILAVQALEQVVLTPKIMGKATGLNPALILLSLSVWGALLGLIGMIIALPVTTLIISYYKRFVLKEDSKPDTTPPNAQPDNESDDILPNDVTTAPESETLQT